MNKNMYIRDLKARDKRIHELEAQRDKLDEEIKNEKAKLKARCHHPQQYIKIDEYYNSGSYLDRAYTDKTPYCSLCGERGKTQTVTHSYYG